MLKNLFTKMVIGVLFCHISTFVCMQKDQPTSRKRNVIQAQIVDSAEGSSRPQHVDKKYLDISGQDIIISRGDYDLLQSDNRKLLSALYRAKRIAQQHKQEIDQRQLSKLLLMQKLQQQQSVIVQMSRQWSRQFAEAAVAYGALQKRNLALEIEKAELRKKLSKQNSSINQKVNSRLQRKKIN